MQFLCCNYMLELFSFTIIIIYIYIILPPSTIPAGPETQTLKTRTWVASPTLYPLGHDCPLIIGILYLIGTHAREDKTDMHIINYLNIVFKQSIRN